jgi:hypothetical protein
MLVWWHGHRLYSARIREAHALAVEDLNRLIDGGVMRWPGVGVFLGGDEVADPAKKSEPLPTPLAVMLLNIEWSVLALASPAQYHDAARQLAQHRRAAARAVADDTARPRLRSMRCPAPLLLLRARSADGPPRRW